MTLRRVVYTSRVARQVRFADAEAIAGAAAIRNARDGLTGLLVYTPSHFIQVLEGDPAALRSTLARIEKDVRHSDLRIVDDDEVESREFAAWAMTARLGSMKPAELERLDAERALILLLGMREPKGDTRDP
jgi:hypothetical protein